MTYKNIPLIYVAGPYRAPTLPDREANILHARKHGEMLAAMGAYPVIPHTNTAHMDDIASDGFWLAGTLTLMLRCDGALFIPGWRLSSGAQTEYDAARRRGIPTLDIDILNLGEAPHKIMREWLERLNKGAA